jgi:hypothetical protein
VIRDRRIGEDQDGYLCLNDVWRVSGESETKAPRRWMQLTTTSELIDALEQSDRFSVGIAETKTKSATYAKGGKGGGTFAHPVLALSYSEYLSPDLAVEVKAVYLRYRAGDITLADEVLAKAEAAREFEESRDISKQVRDKFVSTLATHGARSAIGYITNAAYQVLLGGTKREIVAARNLSTGVALRDKLPLGELLQTINTEYLASERIEELNVRGREPCADATRLAAGVVKDAFERAVRRDEAEPATQG